MDERPGSPEIDVVGDADNLQRFRHRSDRFHYESTSNSNRLRATNENGAKLLAANANKGGKTEETVNLRVRNMGFVTVKKEPESDEDCETSYSLSSLLEECDFDKTPRRRALKSPTSLAMAKAKSLEPARLAGPAQGRPRQSLENVISSLKSARAINDNIPTPGNRQLSFQNPVAPITMPSQIVSVAPPPVFGPPSGSMAGIGPQIVDVRSLASVVRPSTSLNAGHQRRCATNLVDSTSQTPVSQGTATVVSGTKPVNIRFVLPANVPFSTDQFQQVLQATLASVSSQSKTIEPSQLQQAIQAALTSVTKSTVAFNPEQLQQAIQNSLSAVTGSVPVSQVTPTTLSPDAVYLPRGAQRQPQAIAPKPPSVPIQPTVMRVDTFYADRDKPVSGNAVDATTEKQISTSASLSSHTTPVTEAVNKAIDSSQAVSGNSNNQSTSDGFNSSQLSSARDALVKALQKSRVLNSPASSAMSPPTASSAVPAVSLPSANTDYFEHDTFSSSPPSSPGLFMKEAAAPSSNVDTGSSKVASSSSSLTSNNNPPSIVLDSQSHLGQNTTSTPPATQSNVGSEKVPAQSNTQESISPRHLKPATVPVVTSMTSIANGPDPVLLSSVAPMPGSNTQSVNLQISVPFNVSKPTVQGSKAVATGCGCCANCKNNPEPDPDTYKCYFPGCNCVYSTLQGLRKHHYFHPNHKPQIALEKASHSVDYFLPPDLGSCHRNARLRELFKRLTNAEVKELIMPRLTKTVSLSDLLELKSVRANPSRGQPSVSAFKMFSEFERFRKEVENRLMDLILLPQGRGGGKNERKEEIKPLVTTSSSSDSFATTKKSVETIVIDSEEKGARAAPVAGLPRGFTPAVIKPSPSQGTDTGKEVKKASDLSSGAKKADKSVKDSTHGESVEASKPSVLPVPFMKRGTVETDSSKSSDTKPSGDEPSGSDKLAEKVRSSATESAASDSTSQPMETDELQKKDVSAAASEKPTSQSTDVIMVDAEEKTKPLSKEGELKVSGKDKSKASHDPSIDKIEIIDVDSQVLNAETGNLKTLTTEKCLTTTSEEMPKEQSEKQPYLVSEKNEVHLAEKEEDKCVDTGKVMDETAASMNTEKGPTVVNVEEHGNSSQPDKDKCKPGDISMKKTGDKTTGGAQVSVVSEGNRANELSKLSKKPDETNVTTRQKEFREPCASCGKVNESEKTSSSAEVPASSTASSVAQTNDAPLVNELKEKLAAYTIDDDEGIDETNLLEFGLSFAVKWGKVIKKVQTVEARKIARKENYTEQDMKQFIYSKPKDAANAVISSDCHAHPSFFRAYVMPALLDKHIDDFGLFGKKLLSRLYLSRKKYVDVLRSSIGPELAKIVGINIFPTFKRIMDTWEMVKMLPPGGTAKTPLVLVPMPEDGRDVPDDGDEPAPASATISRTVNNVQRVVTKVNDSLKRPSPNDTEQSDKNKKQRLDNSDPQKGTSQTESSGKGVSQSNNTNKGQKAPNINSAGKRAQDNTGQTGGSIKKQSQQPGLASDKSASSGSDKIRTGSASSTGAQQKEVAVASGSVGSTSQCKPTAIAEHGYSKSSSAESIIPKKATIYTSDTSKVGTPPLPLSSAKGSPLYLVPVEKLAPKLIEQFINQAKGDGVKTRSASSAKKPKQPKQGSQVFVLIPSSNPNGSPTIQALTSEEQLKSSGNKKPLLLLPADKVPKTMASQSPTVRRKMVITMVSSIGTTSAKQSAQPKSVTTTSASSTADQQKELASAVQSVTTPIMSTKEGNAESSTTAQVSCKEIISDDPKAVKESADTNVKSLVSVVTNTSALNSATKDDSSAAGTKEGSSSVSGDVNQSELTVSKESDSVAKESTVCTKAMSSAQTGETAATSSQDSDTSMGPNEKTQASATPKNVSAVESEESGGLDILASSLLPSDLTLDNLLKDISGDDSGNEANEMLPLDISEVISSFEDLPVESDASATASSSHDTVAATLQGAACDSDSDARSSSQGSAFDDDRNPYARRQSPRRTPAPSKSPAVSSLVDVSSPNTSGGSREGEDSDTEDGSPPRKRRKAPTRTSVRSSTQVTFVPDKEVPGKGSPSKTKGRKQ